MPPSYFERMLQLADDIFSVRTDPDQLDVNEAVIARLQQIHPASVSEKDDGSGPVCWVIIFPTTQALMQLFLEKKITEKELYERTPLNTPYDAIYLCSAMVLEEFRRQGIAKNLTLSAINKMRQDHPIKTLFVWPFTLEGNQAAESIAQQTGLWLLKRMD